MQVPSESELETLAEEINNITTSTLVTVQDLKRPTWPFMFEYFLSVLHEFGVDTSDIMNPIADDWEETPQSLNFLSAVRLLQALKGLYPGNATLLNEMGVDNLLEPKPSDIRFISAVHNFHQYAVNRIAVCFENPAVEEQRSRAECLKEVPFLYEKVQEQLIQQAEDEKMRECRIAELVEGNNKLKEELASHKLTLGKEQEIVKDLKEKAADLRREIKIIKEKLDMEEKLHETIAKDLVQSPERILLKQEELKKKITSLRKELEELLAKMFEQKKSVKKIKERHDLVLSAMKALESVLPSTVKLETKEKQVRAKKTEQEEKLASMKNELVKKRRAIEDYKLQVVAPLEEKIKETEKKREEASNLFAESRILKKESRNKKLREVLEEKETILSQEMEDVRMKNQYVKDRINAFLEETDATWVAIVEKEKQELKALKETAKKQLEQLASIIEK